MQCSTLNAKIVEKKPQFYFRIFIEINYNENEPKIIRNNFRDLI